LALLADISQWRKLKMLRKWIAVFSAIVLCAIISTAQSENWKQLWNGKDFTGWEHVGPGRFVIESGLLKSEGGMGLLWYTPEKLGNGVVRAIYKTNKKDDNSGVFIRIPEKPTEEWMPVNKGYEVQIDDSMDDYHITGVLYSLTKAMAAPGKTGEWNMMEITLDGPHTVVVLNGVKVTDYREGEPVPPKKARYEPDRGMRPEMGYIGLQNHSNTDTVYFKEVSFRPLKGQ
jgi:Domain of Unknown Function (DUF1080)